MVAVLSQPLILKEIRTNVTGAATIKVQRLQNP